MLLVPLALALGFVFTARAVTVVVEPPPDALAIRGGVVVPFAGRHLARPGRYVVVAELAGHHRLEEPIAVEAGADSIFRFELAPLPGRLRVLTTPSPAKIEIDGRAAGESPLDAVPLEPGPHLVVVRAERHAPHQATVAIEGRDRLQTLEVELVPAFAPIGIRSEPPGATLAVDGEELGVTPLNVELGAGERSLALSLAGYETWTEEVTVVADRPEELPPVRLLPARGRLRLSSEPSGATVTVAGELRGRTPLTLALPPGEPTEVRLARAGHASAVRRVELASGEERALAVALEPVLGSVRVHATPEDALLLVDGEPRGAARQELELSAAPHRIEIRKPGYASYATSVTPKPGFAQELRVTLRTESDAALDRWPREIETPTGERLRLVEPGSFTMGSPRREQGRRANEIERAVRLTRPFYLGVHEVTNRAFRAFRASHSSGIVEQKTLDLDDMPVVRIAWADAVAYCNWLSERAGLPPAYRGEELVEPVGPGFRLPTEAEWAWAARFAGGRSLKYPWGERMPPSGRAGNYADVSAAALVPDHLREYDDGFAAAAPVGSFAPDVLGFFDLGGNAAEWVHDRYGSARSTGGVEVDPLGPASGSSRVVRGSSWRHGRISTLRLAHREPSAGPRDDLSFRIARSPE